MPAAQWEVESIIAPETAIPADTAFDLLEEQIEEAAAAFPAEQRARFRNAVHYVLSRAECLNVDQLAATLAWQRFEKVLSAIEHFDNPAITVDAMRCLGHMNDSQGVFMATLARKHRISRQCLHKRIVRIARYLGVEYECRKPHKSTLEQAAA
jgi:hypothetical protein